MKWLTRNFGWKLLSLAIAVALWILAAREPEVATSLSVPIEFKNIPDDLDIGGDLPDRVRVEVRGPSGRLSRDNLADAAVVLDLADARPGERTYTIRAANLTLPFGVVFYRAVPSQVTVRFDRLVARGVTIKPVFIKTPSGYHIGSAAIEPTKVQIRGPEERVNNISEVMTDPIDLTGVVSEKTFRTRVNVGDPLIRLEAPAEIMVKVTLQRGASRGGS